MFECLKLGKSDEEKKQAAIDKIQAEKEELMAMSEKELLVENIMTMRLVQMKLELLQAKVDKISEEVGHIFVNTSE